jgi:hypothetical protein
MRKAIGKHQSSIEKRTKLVQEEREKENPNQRKIMELTSLANLATARKMGIINGGYGTTTQLHQGLVDIRRSSSWTTKNKSIGRLESSRSTVRWRPLEIFLSGQSTLGSNLLIESTYCSERVRQDFCLCVYCAVYPDDDTRRERAVELVGKVPWTFPPRQWFGKS